MALPNYLAKIKSSGIYRFVWDKSEIAGVPAEVLRLVVGYSEKGPFNTPVYVRSEAEFKTIFGGINKKLEKRGVWFNRLAIQALSKGPIIALNLKKFANETVDAASFNVTESVSGTIGIEDIPVESIYDTTRFWKLDPEAILPATAKIDRKNIEYISLTAADSKETSCSVFIRGYKPTGYDVTVKNWYATLGEDVPDYFVNGDTDYSALLVSDFFAEIYVFRGEFTPALCSTEPLRNYFDIDAETGFPKLKEYVENAFGDKVDTLSALAADSASNFVNSYSGILLPNFKSQNGQYISLDLVFNTDNAVHKMMLNLNSDLLNGTDLTPGDLVTTGWVNGENDCLFGFLPKRTQQNYKLENTSSTTVSVGDETLKLANVYSGAYSDEEGHEATVFAPDFIKIDGNTEDMLEEFKYIEGYEYKHDGTAEIPNPDSTATQVPTVTAQKYVATGESYLDHGELYIYNDGTGDKTYSTDEQTSTLTTVELVPLETRNIVQRITNYEDSSEESVNAYYRHVASDVQIDSVGYDWWKAATSVLLKAFDANGEEIQDATQNIYFDVDGIAYYKNNENVITQLDVTIEGKVQSQITEKVDIVGTEIRKPDFVSLGIQVGDRLILTDDEISGGTNSGATVDSRFRNLFIITELDSEILKATDLAGNEVSVTNSQTITWCNHSCSITNYNLAPYFFEGYVYEHAAPTDEYGNLSTDDWFKLKWQKFILSALTDYQGLRVGLTNRTDIDYRYIVDTFEAYVDSEVHKELALICKEKENAVAFLNFPAVKTFKNCKYSSFTDEQGRFQVKYIAQGANKMKNPGVLFSLVSEQNGASFASYNTPLLFTDGTVKNNVPAAALVSNNFMDKYEGRQPYYVVAGPNYGRLNYTGLVGPDFNYSRADLDILEPMGVNATVYVPRLGTYINSNKTAKQNPVTALSALNVRELVIYLQDEIEALLQDYQWEFNTPYLRDLIKAKADTICERVKNNGGIQAYLNVCDESNNTDDVIDNEMFVLSTSIEPGRACGKMVQELTIYRSGQLQAIIR